MTESEAKIQLQMDLVACGYGKHWVRVEAEFDYRTLSKSVDDAYTEMSAELKAYNYRETRRLM
jgi:hypothetical protein